MLFSARIFAVPPVDSSYIPRLLKAFEKSIMPVLSDTLNRARVIFLFMQTFFNYMGWVEGVTKNLSDISKFYDMSYCSSFFRSVLLLKPKALAALV